MEQLHRIPDQVENLLTTLESLREDLFDNNIGFIRKKIGQIVRGQSEGSFSNLNNYLVAVQRIAENCQQYWLRKGMTEDGYRLLHEQLDGLKTSLNPIISIHREHPEEIRKVVHATKLRLSKFLGFFVTHAAEARRKPKTRAVRASKKNKSSQKYNQKPSLPPRKIARTPQERVWRAFERLEDDQRGRSAM